MLRISKIHKTVFCWNGLVYTTPTISYTQLHYTILHYTILYYTTLHYTQLQVKGLPESHQALKRAVELRALVIGKRELYGNR